MEMPEMLTGESLTRLIQGALVGAVVTTFLGFNYAGWTLGSTAAKQAEQSSSEAVVAALAPICVDKFQQGAEAKATLVKLKATESWKRDSFIQEGGWATFPGAGSPQRAVAEACAQALNALK